MTQPTTEMSFALPEMSCGHCAQSVTEELSQLPGVQDVIVDVVAGKLRLTGSQDLSPEQVGEAVRRAGYDLVGASAA